MTTILISGLTCAGKSTLLFLLQTEGIRRVVTATTRAPRTGEANGRDYRFLTAEEFAAMEQAGEFAEINEFSGQKYGTPIKELQQPGIKAVVVDPNGHRSLKKFLKREGLPYLSVFLDADPDLQARRFMSRCTTEVEAAKISGQYINGVVSAAATRLSKMLTEEAHWRDVARCKETPYDLVIDSFNSHTCTGHVEAIIRRAKEAA